MNVPVTEEQIRTLAYRLWEEAGSPDGQSDEFWILAQQKLASEPGMAAVEGEAMAKTPLAVDSKTEKPLIGPDSRIRWPLVAGRPSTR